jgi:hypothetical protein
MPPIVWSLGRILVYFVFCIDATPFDPLRDFWGAVLRDCTNVLTSAVSAFAQIPVPEALAIAGSADEHQRLHLDQSGRFWIEAWTDYVGD